MIASGLITSWQIDEGTTETVRDFIFLGSKITADGDCSHEIKRCLLFGRIYDQPRQHIKKQRHHFADKVYILKSTFFPVLLYGCESWTIENVEH